MRCAVGAQRTPARDTPLRVCRGTSWAQLRRTVPGGLLACGERSALSRLGAAELHRASRWPKTISVVTTTHRRPDRVDVHHCRRLDPRDRRALQRANGRRGVKRVERAIELHLDGSAGTRSRAEDDFLATLPDIDAVRVNSRIEVDVLFPETKEI